MIDSHRQQDIVEIFMRQPLKVREQVEEVSVDMWGGFPKVIQQVFPNAQLVIPLLQNNATVAIADRI